MLRSRWSLALTALVALVMGAATIASSAAAQGVTSGAISGTITDEAGAPVDNAQIQVVNTSTGARAGSITRETGRYVVGGLEVGGPYVITVRRIGFAPESREGINVSLGQTVKADFKLSKQAATLTAVRVTGTTDPAISKTKTGVSTTVSDSALRRLPSLNRNFTDFVALVPQIATAYTGPNGTPGISGGGVNNRYNNIQIDGASENDLFGLGSTGQPGGQANGKSISVESVKEYQVLLSPFDVRQGNFAGAQINAVTKSGTNDLHGSAYIYGYNEKLARDVPQIRSAPYTQKQYGFTLGGPIVKNRIHFFVNPEWQRRDQPAAGPYLGQPAGAPVPVFVASDTITRFQQILKNQYGIDAGSAGLYTNHNPLLNVFARLDFEQLPLNSRFVIRENYGQATQDIFSRSASVNGTFGLTSNLYQFQSLKHGTVGQLYTNFSNGVGNELFVGYNTTRDRRSPMSRAPQITVTTASAGGPGVASLRAGAEAFSQGNQLDQDVLELTDNLTIPVGAHQFVLGTKNEFFKFRNLFAQNSYGVWGFSSLDNLAAGTPNSYNVGAAPQGDINARFRAATYGFYGEDIWSVTDRFTFTYGLRVDIPTLKDHPPTNPLFLQQTGYNTATVPSGNMEYSPRAGFNWDITGDQRNQLRGGAGIFVGRPAYVWVGNAFANNGIAGGVLNLSCNSTDALPTFNAANISTPPTACGTKTAAAAGEIDIINKHLRMPSDARLSLGFDHRFDNGTLVSLEGLYTKGVNNFFYVNSALAGRQGTDRFGRAMFGDISSSGIGQPVLIGSGQRREIYNILNESNDRSYSITGTAQRRFSNRLEGSVSYSYGHSYTVEDQTSSRAVSNYRFGRTLTGDEFQDFAGTSVFDRPHRIVANGTYSFPTKTDISFIYRGESGTAYDYIYSGSGGRGDANGDGTLNDLVFVPTTPTDPNQIMWAYSSAVKSTADAATKMADIQAQQAAFKSFLDKEPCLADAEGKLLKRNSCRSPWTNSLNVSVRQSLSAFHAQNLSLQLDVFNFLNLLNSRWGQFKVPPFQGSQNLLNQVAQCAANAWDPIGNKCTTPASALTTAGTGSVGVYTFNTGLQRYITLPAQSNYQLNLSVKYTF